jgi:hypothetical protein
MVELAGFSTSSRTRTGSQLLLTRATLLSVLGRIKEPVQRHTDQLSGCSWHRNAATIPFSGFTTATTARVIDEARRRA